VISYPRRSFGAVAIDYADAWFQVHPMTRPSLNAADRWRQLRLVAIHHPDRDLEFQSRSTNEQVAIMLGIELFARFESGEIRVERRPIDNTGDAA
jgi:hypothetical protein